MHIIKNTIFLTKNYYDYKNSSNQDIQLSDFSNGYHNESNVIIKTFDVNLFKNIEFGTNITGHNCLPKRAHSSAILYESNFCLTS